MHWNTIDKLAPVWAFKAKHAWYEIFYRHIHYSMWLMMHVEDPCLVEEEFPNPVIALLTAFRHYNRNNRQTFSARRRNIAFTRIWYYYIVDKSNSYIHERIILIKRTIEKIWREKSLPSKWNCLRSGFLALGRASQLKVHLRTKREREQKQTYICFLKVSVPTSPAKNKTYYIHNLFKNRHRWLPFPRWFVSLT